MHGRGVQEIAGFLCGIARHRGKIDAARIRGQRFAAAHAGFFAVAGNGRDVSGDGAPVRRYVQPQRIDQIRAFILRFHAAAVAGFDARIRIQRHPFQIARHFDLIARGQRFQLRARRGRFGICIRTGVQKFRIGIFGHLRAFLRRTNQHIDRVLIHHLRGSAARFAADQRAEAQIKGFRRAVFDDFAAIDARFKFIGLGYEYLRRVKARAFCAFQ